MKTNRLVNKRIITVLASILSQLMALVTPTYDDYMADLIQNTRHDVEIATSYPISREKKSQSPALYMMLEANRLLCYSYWPYMFFAFANPRQLWIPREPTLSVWIGIFK